MIDGALRLKEKGLVFHVRYNAANSGAEVDAFPCLGGEDRPGVVAFTATAWRRLLNRKKMPLGEATPSAADCYRVRSLSGLS